MSAVISDCGKFRYRLERDVQLDGLLIAYFGVNPSTADANLDDATVRKWRGFTKVNGGRRFIVGNVWAYRSTDVNALAAAADPIGQGNWMHVRRIINEADILVPCWGSETKVPDRLRGTFSTVKSWLAESGKPVKCFGFTKDGGPKHPLMLSYSTPLVDYFKAHEATA